MTDIGTFTAAKMEHAVELARTLRPECLADVLECGFTSGIDALTRSIAASDVAYAWLLGGEVAAVFGMSDRGWMPGSTAGGMWILTSTLVARKPRSFLRASRPALQLLLGSRGHLANYVDSRFAASVRWLRWLGCEVGPAVPRGPNGVLFHPVSVKAGA